MIPLRWLVPVFRFLTARNFLRIEKADQGHCNIFVSLDYIIYTLPKTAVILSSAVTMATFQKEITKTAVMNIVFQCIFIELDVSYASQHTFSKVTVRIFETYIFNNYSMSARWI